MRRIAIRQTLKQIGKSVLIKGWVHNIRSHGKIVFIDLRDESGIIQVIFKSDDIKEIRPEWVVAITGIINQRPQNMINPDIETGTIEMKAESIEVLSKAKTIPFEIDSPGKDINEELRLKYRYIDLRRKRLQKNIRKRFEALQFFRNYLGEQKFIEIETPILSKSTPEGARDFLVPYRYSLGEFYALPQSPQQYKQLLMVSGFEKYFQIARCFRDEDSRANRQAEFTQIDMEMSFMDQEEIMEIVEKMVIEMITKIFPDKKIAQKPFPIITYNEAMEQYQTDKPDIRKDKDDLAFLWVIDFPMFEWSEKDKKWEAMHNPFSRTVETDPKKIKEDPKQVKAFQYDLVLNGEEVGGGGLRSYNKELLELVFEILGHKKEEVQSNFGHLLNAFDYGVPPHGGLALGFDRFISILLNEDNIREVIAFPKGGDARDLMINAPSKIKNQQLKELNIKIIKDEE